MDELEAQKQIDDMTRVKVIEQSESAHFNSPIFLVQKKNGTKRLVVDLRGINRLIVPKLVQLPKITDLLQEITATKALFLSLTDIRSVSYTHLTLPTKRIV